MHVCVHVCLFLSVYFSDILSTQITIQTAKTHITSKAKIKKEKEENLKKKKKRREKDNLPLTNSHTYLKSHCKNGGGG